MATAVSSRAISLQWTASANDGGTPLTTYLVQYRVSADSGVEFQSRTFDASVLSANLDNLAPFTNYEVRVRAENLAGLSDPSNSLQSLTHPEGERDETPQNSCETLF